MQPGNGHRSAWVVTNLFADFGGLPFCPEGSRVRRAKVLALPSRFVRAMLVGKKALFQMILRMNARMCAMFKEFQDSWEKKEQSSSLKKYRAIHKSVIGLDT